MKKLRMEQENGSAAMIYRAICAKSTRPRQIELGLMALMLLRMQIGKRAATLCQIRATRLKKAHCSATSFSEIYWTANACVRPAGHRALNIKHAAIFSGYF
jgi:hypothetical protein